ncbi:unnamed protein product, partial [Allacma fusca]
MTNGRLI